MSISNREFKIPKLNISKYNHTIHYDQVGFIIGMQREFGNLLKQFMPLADEKKTQHLAFIDQVCISRLSYKGFTWAHLILIITL